ncbi:MAG: ribonuclease III [Oscillospiraceae bacterium]
MEPLEKKLAHVFGNGALLTNALTHSSYANENRSRSCESNERLEFVGDSVLGMVVASALYERYPNMPEGRMTRLRAQLVCEESLYKVALELDLGAYIRLGKGEEHSGGRTRTSILADAVEAVIAALFLDGGMEVARDFIDSRILAELGEELDLAVTDSKTELQETVQKKSGQALSYELLSESGPDHDKLFTVRVSLNGESVGVGTGRTKKEAEQSAAARALEALAK